MQASARHSTSHRAGSAAIEVGAVHLHRPEAIEVLNDRSKVGVLATSQTDLPQNKSAPPSPAGRFELN